MSLESLLVYVDADREQTNLVRVAAEIAGRYGSSITGLSALGIRPPFVAEGVVIDVGGEADIDRIKGLLAVREAWLRGAARKFGQSLEWRSGVEAPTEKLVREAGGADLIVMSPTRDTNDRYSRPDIAEAMLRAGRPFLVVPDGADALKADRVVVGWKNTREARRAVADALPFLVRASEVTIVEICERPEFQRAFSEVEELKRYLERHKIGSCFEQVVWSDKAIGKQLLDVAHRTGADLIVTGAYGHTRLGEWIFGGATRELLMSSDVCCLMSH